ncbi:MAG: ATP-dependent transcriptional regulator [Roseobacter sp. MedPE-SW]|nr:MAG: ATP-dependent transcriptional regulator [Roseobacter sp. MedPE-SW]
MRRFALPLALAALVSACALPDSQKPASRAALADASLPAAKAFSAPRPQPPQRANRDIARDFLDLHFRLEGGTTLPVFTRFERPIRLRVAGTPSQGFQRDLTQLLQRFKQEAGIDIQRVNSGPVEITVQAVSSRAIHRALPKAACFVVPNVDSLAELRRKRRNPETNWSNLRHRERLAVFVPNDISPQEARDCLHEELAQAIGPLNDLYRLPDSVFNDDNVHTVLTGFDMLVLRATYAPELRTGMSRSEVAAKLPALLSRLNPAGDAIPPRALPATSRSWIAAIETALGPGSALNTRKRAANQAVVLARELGWSDHRRAYSHYVLGRMIQAEEPDLAQRHFQTALDFLSQTPDSALHQAIIRPRMAAYQIARGDGEAALQQINPALPVASRHENAALLATSLLIKAEALDLLGQFATAHTVRLDSLGWARYGFGPDWAVQAKIREVAELRPSTN